MSAETKIRWFVLTGEYPPSPGGVSDYTRLVAVGLAAAGDEVVVWTPAPKRAADAADNDYSIDSNVEIRQSPDHFGWRSRRLLSANLAQDSTARVLIQYVPHAYGYKGMNLPFAAWVARQGKRREVCTLFHEVAFPLGRQQRVRHNLLAVVNRVMARLVARASRRIFVTIPAWEEVLRPMLRPGRKVEWLPVPSTLPTVVPAKIVERVRQHVAGSASGERRSVIGHFGTFGDRIGAVLSDVLGPILLADPRRVGLLIGRGGAEFARSMLAAQPALKGRLVATGGLSAIDAAAHVAACDLMVQPYLDGVSCRRTTTMASLALGVAVVTNVGHLTEPIWASSGAVVLLPDARAETYATAVAAICDDDGRRGEVGWLGKALYAERFSIEHTIRTLRSTHPTVER